MMPPSVDVEKGDGCITANTGTSRSSLPGDSFQTPDQEPETPRTESGTSTCSTGMPLSIPKQRISSLLSSLKRTWESLSFSCSKNPANDKAQNVPRERQTIVRNIHTYPHGYPKLAAFLDSDENFMIYRRFGYLAARILVEKQDDLQQLEDELKRMDFSDLDTDEKALMSRRSQDAARVSLMTRIEQKWLEYSQLLAATQQTSSLNRPTSGEYRSVKNWIHNILPVDDQDWEFIVHKEDLITLRTGREYAWLDASVEKFLQLFHCSLIMHLFQSKETRQKTDGTGKEIYYTRSRIERFVLLIITLMILVLLLVPIFVLYHLTADDKSPRTNFICIGVLLVFTLAFSACISLFTKAKRHEILAASAAYCAVLVVFIGNVGGRAG